MLSHRCIFYFLIVDTNTSVKSLKIIFITDTELFATCKLQHAIVVTTTAINGPPS